MPEQTIETIEVPTAGAMQDLGRRLAAGLRAGDLLVLTGPLGAGKTTLVQGIGEGLGVRGPITSPTFVIARVHPSLTRWPGRWCTPTPTGSVVPRRSTTWIWTPARPVR